MERSETIKLGQVHFVLSDTYIDDMVNHSYVAHGQDERLIKMFVKAMTRDPDLFDFIGRVYRTALVVKASPSFVKEIFLSDRPLGPEDVPPMNVDEVINNIFKKEE